MEHHIVLLIDEKDGEACRSFFQGLLATLSGEKKRVYLHFNNSTKLQRYLPRHPYLKLEPNKQMVTTREAAEKLAKKWVGSEVVVLVKEEKVSPEQLPKKEESKKREQAVAVAVAVAVPVPATEEECPWWTGQPERLQRLCFWSEKWSKKREAARLQRLMKEWFSCPSPVVRQQLSILCSEMVLEVQKEMEVGGEWVANHQKLTGLDGWVWINVDESADRRRKMEQQLKRVQGLKSQRASALTPTMVHRRLLDKLHVAFELEDRLLCVSLSHLKAINLVSGMQGNGWFLVTEDDVTCAFLDLQEKPLMAVLNEAPEDAEIIKLHQLSWTTMPANAQYDRWESMVNNGASASAYAIKKEAAVRIASMYRVTKRNEIRLPEDIKLNVADDFVFTLATTYQYEWNYLETENETSLLHEDHLSCHRESQRNNFIRLLQGMLTLP